MADLQVTKNILNGTAEYVVVVPKVEDSGGAIGPGEHIRVKLDNDFILDDLLIFGLTGSESIPIDIYLDSTSGAELNVTPGGHTITSANPYRLNTGDDDRNMWFRLPAWSTLRIDINSFEATGGALQISLVGRG